MQLKQSLAAFAFALGLALPAAALGQSLSPMEKTGTTPSDIKGFKLLVGNPYSGRMTFVIVPMNPEFTAVASEAVVRPNEIRLAPGAGRTVTVQFRIGAETKERTIGVCVMPKDIEGPVLPRVCGTYTGVALTHRGG
jgi:hypothetical protein